MNAKTRLPSGRTLALLLAAAGFVVPFFLDLPGLSEAGHRLLGIFLLAVILWVTEAIPLFATSAMVILLLVLFLSDVSTNLAWAWGAADGFGTAGMPKYTEYFNSLANQVLILFLGGFFLAFGAAKFGLDRNLAALMLRPFGTRPSRVLFGLMLITGVLSMWMSNTATTATIMAVMLPLIHKLERDDKFRVALALGVPFAANIGGIGTPIGTPPNAIVLGAMAKVDPATGEPLVRCSFGQWMVFAVPVAMLLMLAAWLLLVFALPSKSGRIEVDMNVKWRKSRPAMIFYATAAVTIGLWVTEALHGINSYVVGMVPVVVLLATGVVGSKEFRQLDWDVLWLVAGGIALGSGVAKTGFDAWVVGLIDWSAVSPALLGVLIGLTALVLSTFISNSAAANLLAPISMAVAVSTGSSVVTLVVFVALGSSMAMALPISTPPNAIAYSTGSLNTRQMAAAGSVIALIGMVLTFLLLPGLLKLAGLG